MKYRYLCKDCEVVTERVVAMTAFTETIQCPHCGSSAHHLFEGAPAVARSGEYNAPIDVAIGRDANLRWAAIEERQQKRDKVRKESGKVGLTATGYEQFTPISTEDQKKRTSAFRAAERDGFKPTYDSPAESSAVDKKL